MNYEKWKIIYMSHLHNKYYQKNKNDLFDFLDIAENNFLN